MSRFDEIRASVRSSILLSLDVRVTLRHRQINYREPAGLNEGMSPRETGMNSLLSSPVLSNSIRDRRGSTSNSSRTVGRRKPQPVILCSNDLELHGRCYVSPGYYPGW
jgi:hypothetical protein